MSPPIASRQATRPPSGAFASYFPNSGTAPFWITVDQGQVTKISQQFLP